MAAFFVGTSTLFADNPLITAVPITVGMWCKLTAVGTVVRTLWGLSDTATTNNYFRITMTTTELLGVGARAGGVEAISSVATAMTAGAWYFVLCRLITAANRRIAVLHSNGVMEHAQNTTSLTPAGIDSQTVGALSTTSITDFWDGHIGEFWYANIDVQADGAQLTNDLLRQLAFGGPFSVPHIVPSIIEYRSWRKHLIRAMDDSSEVFQHGSLGRGGDWLDTAGTTVKDHPPLPYWYVKPGQNKRVLIV